MRSLLLVAAGLLLVACDGIKIPPCILDGTCIPSPSPAPAASPVIEPSLPPPASPVPSPVVTPPPTPVPSPVVTPGPTPSPCVVKPVCVDDSGTPMPDCTRSCAVWIAGGLAAHHLDLCTDGKPGACAGAKDRAYNPVPGLAEGRECFDMKSCNVVWCGSGELRNRRPWKDGSLCFPVDCVKATVAEPCTSPPPPPPPPTPFPSPTPRPTSSPTPLPTGAPPIDPATGNYPLPPDGVCPPWFKDQFDRVGIHVAGSTPCGQGTVCRRVTLWATQKASPPYLPHAVGRREGEMWAPCQEPQFIDYINVDDAGFGGVPPGILMQISHPDWNSVWGRLDKQTCDSRNEACPPGMTNPVHNFNGHDKSVDRAGVTTARACLPDGTKCSETTYRTDSAVRRGAPRACSKNKPEDCGCVREGVFIVSTATCKGGAARGR